MPPLRKMPLFALPKEPMPEELSKAANSVALFTVIWPLKLLPGLSMRTVDWPEKVRPPLPPMTPLSSVPQLDPSCLE